MLVVVGGHSRDIGKTSVVCSIIRALREWEWTAIKITQFGHGVCARNGEPCPCADPTHPVAISEEFEREGGDSARFLGAGARRSFWVRTPMGRLNEAMPRVRKIIGEGGNVIVESNSILRFVKPDFCAMVLDGAVADFKATSRTYLDRADALVQTSAADLEWVDVPRSLLRDKPVFFAPAPGYESEELVAALKCGRGSAD